MAGISRQGKEGHLLHTQRLEAWQTAVSERWKQMDGSRKLSSQTVQAVDGRGQKEDARGNGVRKPRTLHAGRGAGPGEQRQ